MRSVGLADGWTRSLATTVTLSVRRETMRRAMLATSTTGAVPSWAGVTSRGAGPGRAGAGESGGTVTTKLRLAALPARSTTVSVPIHVPAL